jgi:hypothetical protein
VLKRLIPKHGSRLKKGPTMHSGPLGDASFVACVAEGVARHIFDFLLAAAPP